MFQCTYVSPRPQPRPLADLASWGHCHPRPCPATCGCGFERPLNLPNTKKLKYFNILFFFLVPEFILWVLGSHCVIHIYIYIYIICIYILYFFWLGLFLIQSYKMVASPRPKGCLSPCGEGGGRSPRAGRATVQVPRGGSGPPRWTEVARSTGKTHSPQETWGFWPKETAGWAACGGGRLSPSWC